uniref:Uncharacterized protein n=1 Tax=Romanomermis culicivorax TaxID=13658 RepID=A0A915KU47_ROMCU
MQQYKNKTISVTIQNVVNNCTEGRESRSTDNASFYAGSKSDQAAGNGAGRRAVFPIAFGSITFDQTFRTGEHGAQNGEIFGNASEFHSNSLFVLSQPTLRLSMTVELGTEIFIFGGSSEQKN